MTDAPPVRRWPNATAVLVAAVALAYANAVNTGFVFDDVHWISQNATIGDAAAYLRGGGTRWLGLLSIVANHRLGGVNPLGYHLFNVAVHALAVVTLFGLLRRVLALPRFGGRHAARGERLAFAVALLWAVHPLNTQAVTYVIQRFESMMGLFFLLTLYCWTRGATDGPPRLWYPLAVLSYLACCHCKEVCVALPPVLWAFDRVFLARSWREVARARWLPHLAVAGLFAYVLRPVLTTALAPTGEGGGGDAGVGFTLPVTPFQYLFTQTEVILHYLRLAVWPVGQCGDMVDWPIADSLAEVWPAAVAVTALFVAGVALLAVRPALGVLFAWFFLILAPTSSIVPIRDAAFEHRMYLPLIAVLTGLVLAADAALAAIRFRYSFGRAAAGGVLLTVAAVALGRLTVLRNPVYRNDDAFVEDVASKRPNNLRALGEVAGLRMRQGRFDDAQRILDAIFAKDTSELTFRIQLGQIAYLNGRFERAADFYRLLLTDPSPSMPRYVYPVLIPCELAAKRYPGAADVARKQVALAPQSAAHRLTLAACELAAGNPAAARAAAAEAVARDPNAARGPAAESRAAVLGRHPIPAAQKGLWEVAYWRAAAANLADGDRNPEWLDTQAQLAARTGRFPDAVATARKGITASAADPLWKADHEQRLKLYEANQVYGPKD